MQEGLFCSSLIIRRAFAQGVSDHQGRSPLDFDIDFSFVRFLFYVFEIFAIGTLQSKPTQTAIFDLFSKPEAYTRIRITFRARTIVSCLRSAHARRAVREPGAMVIVSRLRQGGTFFLERFSERFFSQSWCQMEAQMASKIKENRQKNRLGTKPTKHVENVLILKPSDMQETRFRMEGLSKITKTRGADKCKNISKNGTEINYKSMKNRLRNSTKNDA